jgi:hypothetical protein
MDKKRALPVILTGTLSGIFFIFLNIFFNPQFTAGKDMIHRAGALLFSTQFFENHPTPGVFFAISLLLVLSTGYSWLIMILIKKRDTLSAVTRSIIPGIGLYIFRIPFYIHHKGIVAYVAASWIILVIYIIYSMSVAWQYKWFRKTLGKLMN